MGTFVFPHPANPALGTDLVDPAAFTGTGELRFPINVGVSSPSNRVNVDFGGDAFQLPAGISYIIPNMIGGSGITISNWDETGSVSFDSGLSGTPTLRVEVDLAGGILSDFDVQAVL